MYVYRLSLRNVNQSKEKKSKNDMPFIFKSISVLSKVNIAKLSPAELFLCTTPFLKPSLSTEILSINDFITKLLSKLQWDLSNRVHLKSISKFINKVIKRFYFCKLTLKNKSIYKNIVC